MPELPEVETVVRGLQPLVGSTVKSIDYSKIKGLLKNDKPEALSLLVGWTLSSVVRRGKWIKFRWVDNRQNNHCLVQGLLSHLGMFGGWIINGPLTSRSRLTLELDGPAGAVDLTYEDLRSWGRLYIGSVNWTESYLNHLGPDALNIDPTYMINKLSRTTATVVEALLDQSLIAGIGNIYRSEVLNLSGISPDRPCTDLTQSDVIRLCSAINEVLHAAIQDRGSSISDYRGTDGSSGSHQHKLMAYGKHGHRCVQTGCNGSIVKTNRWDRSVYYCASCQK